MLFFGADDLWWSIHYVIANDRSTQMLYPIVGKIGGTKFWWMSKKGCFGEYNFDDSIHAIDHTHLLPAHGRMDSRFCLEVMVRGYHVYYNIWQASRNEILQEAREAPRLFGKRSLHVATCASTPKTPPSGQNFGELKFGDQASIYQIRQNLLPPIFFAIRYYYGLMI